MSRRRRRSRGSSARARTGRRRRGTFPRRDPGGGRLILPRGKRLADGLSHARGRHELLMFAVVYLLYDASRWVFAGRFPTAAAHARWVIDLERSMHVAVERSVQRAFAAGPAEWLLSNEATLRACWARALALMWGPLVTVSVVATGNHYVFDVAAGLLVTGLAYAAVRFSPRPTLPRRQGRVPSRPVPATGS